MNDKKSPALERAKAQLRGSKDLRSTLALVRGTLNPTHFSALLAWIPRILYRGRGAVSGQFPTSISKLRSDLILTAIDPEREIQWATAYLAPYSTRINQFLERAREYEGHLLAGNFEKCETSLKEIEAYSGISLWLIETRIALLQAAFGLEQQKTYLESIRESRPPHDVVSAIAFYVSRRNESTTNPLRFDSQMSEQIDTWDLDGDFSAYLNFKLSDFGEFDLERCAHVLRFEATSAIVDYYDTYIRLAQSSVLASDVPSAFRNGLMALSLVINDPRIIKILLLAGAHAKTTVLERQHLESYDLSVQGHFPAAIVSAERGRAANPRDINLSLVSAMSKAHIGDRNGGTTTAGLAGRISDLATKIAEKAEATEDAFIEILRICTALRLMSFSASIENYAVDQFSGELPSARTALKSFVSSPFLDPREISILPPQIRNEYALAVVEAYGVTPGVGAELLRGKIWDDDAILRAYDPHARSESLLEIGIGRAYEDGKLEQALAQAVKLDKTSDPYARRIAARYIANCLLGLGRLEEAINFIVERSIDEPGIVQMLPVNVAVERLDKNQRKLLAGNISTPIILDLFSRSVSDRLDNIRAYAYEDFLIANGMERPSELVEMTEKFRLPLLVYYLRKICIPEIMQVSSVFRGSHEVEQERFAICVLLSKLDASNISEHESEIQEISRNRIIRLGVRHIDQSRIYVDVAAIRRWADKNLKEGFARYQALLKTGVDPGAAVFVEALKIALSVEPSTQTALELPKNEASGLLVEIVKAIFRECMTNPEHGLDCYLSMRIRHGALSGQFRGPLEEEKIITQREGGSQRYKANDFWRARFQSLDAEIRAKLDLRMAKFSADYDALIETFANESIQVSSKKKPNGLFLSAVPELILVALAVNTGQDTTFEDFLTMCFNAFWTWVEIILKNVRTAILTDLKNGINRLFVSLQSDVVEVMGDAPARELTRAILLAQTGAQKATNQVTEWFQLRKPESQLKLTFEEIIDVALQFVSTMHRDFSPRIVSEIAPMSPFVELTLLFDVFFIVFENIQKHSGLSSPQVEIRALQDRNKLKFMVKSEVLPSARHRIEVEKVARIKDAIAKGSYQSGATSEGGSGLMKLRKIIGRDTEAGDSFDFGFNADGWFFVELELLFQEVI